MAERRMFAKTIIDSDAFLDMPVTARLLYYDLAMRADDDGFINSPKKIMRIIGASQDDLTVLIAKKFIIPFDSGVVVIKHWRIHNYIAKDRYNETKYKEEKATLKLDENRAYTLNDNKMYTGCIQDAYSSETQVRLGKVRLGKDNTLSKRDRFVPPSFDDVREYCTTLNYHFDINEFIDFYTSKGWKVGNQSMKDWKAAVRNWVRNHSNKPKPNNLGTFADYKQTSSDGEWDELTDMAFKEVNR